MIVIYDTFVCKPGKASQVAKMCKEMMGGMGNVQVMTDLTGIFHRVVMASTYDSVADWEKEMKKMMDGSNKSMKSKEYQNMQDMYVSGGREIFRIW